MNTKINNDTLILNGVIHLENYFKNMKMYEQMEPVHNLFKNKYKYPAICIASGPSLMEFIEEIKIAKKTHIIICVDSAFKILIENGIKPHIVTAADPIINKFEYIINNSNLTKDIILVATTKANNGLIRSWKGKKYIYLQDKHGESETPFEGIVYPNAKRYGMAYTVANMSLTIASNLTSGNITLAGQDLCIKEYSHSQGASLNKKIRYNIINENLYFKLDDNDEPTRAVFVNGYDKKALISTASFKFYIKMFEKQIRDIDNNIYNLTRNGAKITNAKRVFDLGENITINNMFKLLRCKNKYTNSNIKKLKEELLLSIDNIDILRSGIKYHLMRAEQKFPIKNKNTKHKELSDGITKTMAMDSTLSLFINVLSVRGILAYLAIKKDKKANHLSALTSLAKIMLKNIDKLHDLLLSALI